MLKLIDPNTPKSAVILSPLSIFNGKEQVPVETIRPLSRVILF